MAAISGGLVAGREEQTGRLLVDLQYFQGGLLAELQNFRLVGVGLQVLKRQFANGFGRRAKALDRSDLEESIRERLNAAQKVSDYQVDLVQQVADEERKQLDETQAKRRKKAEDDASDDFYRIHKKMADEDKARRFSIEDLNASADEKRLRRTGHGEEADVNEIVRRAKRDVDEAHGDKDRDKAILANAEEDILGLRHDRSQVAEAIASSSASRLNIFGGDATNDELTSTQKQALDVLKAIRDKTGTALTSP